MSEENILAMTQMHCSSESFPSDSNKFQDSAKSDLMILADVAASSERLLLGIDPFVGSSCFINWLNFKNIFPGIVRNGDLQLVGKIIDAIFDEIVGLTVILTDEANKPITSFDLNRLPDEMKPLFGDGTSPRNMNTGVEIMPKTFLEERIYKYGKSDPAAFVVTLIYLQRLINAYDPWPILNNISFPRIYGMAFVLATKLVQDQVFKNKYYARVIGVPAGKFVEMEFCFLNLLNFDIFVSAEQFEQTVRWVCRNVEFK